MYPFQAIYPAHCVQEAISLWQAHPGARWIAGGSDLLIALRDGKLDRAELISLQQIEQLRGVKLETDGTLCILPLTSFDALEHDPILQETVPVLAQAAGQVGGPQIRNIGTVGGNLCNGATSADTASTLLAYDAMLELTGPDGSRLLSIHDFYLGPKRVALQPGELLTAIRIKPEAYQGYFGQYIKFATRRAMDIATLGCSVNVKLDQTRSCLANLRIGFGVAAPVPIRAKLTEQQFRGEKLTHKLTAQIAAAVQQDIRPRTSWRASEEYRRILAEELTKRALEHSIAQAGGIYG